MAQILTTQDYTQKSNETITKI